MNSETLSIMCVKLWGLSVEDIQFKKLRKLKKLDIKIKKFRRK